MNQSAPNPRRFSKPGLIYDFPHARFVIFKYGPAVFHRDIQKKSPLEIEWEPRIYEPGFQCS